METKAPGVNRARCGHRLSLGSRAGDLLAPWEISAYTGASPPSKPPSREDATVSHMDQQETQTDTTPSGSSGAGRGKHPRSLANLRPPWRPGLSGNPSGLTKDGQAPKVAKLRASLLERLERSGTMDRLAARWLSLAMRGSYPHLQAILERIDPIEKDQDQGKTILQGLKLEITAGGASLTMGQATLQPQHTQELTAAASPESFARDDGPESRTGGPQVQDVQESPPTS